MAATWSAISHSRVSRPFPSSASKREHWVLILARRGVRLAPSTASANRTTISQRIVWPSGRCNSSAFGASDQKPQIDHPLASLE